MIQIGSSNGWGSDLTTDTENLLPILVNTTSPAIRKRTHNALTLVYAASAESSNLHLRAKLADALEQYSVQKMDGTK